MTLPENLWRARPEYLTSYVYGAVNIGRDSADEMDLVYGILRPWTGTPHANEPNLYAPTAAGGTSTHVEILGYSRTVYGVEASYINLYDATARSLAAEYYTVVSNPLSGRLPYSDVLGNGDVLDGPELWVEDDSAVGGVSLTSIARAMVAILCRMRMRDLTVTTAEARAALGWAEGVADRWLGREDSPLAPGRT